MIDQLTASDFETVTFDLPGFGERPEACGPYTYDRFAADVAAVVDTVGKPFVLVGHSMSGRSSSWLPRPALTVQLA